MGERAGRAGPPGSHSARASSIQRRRSSGTNRSGPSRPPMRIEGMRPVLAASYSQVRETPSRAATSAGLRRSGVLICWLLTWVIDRERPKTANELPSGPVRRRRYGSNRRGTSVRWWASRSDESGQHCLVDGRTESSIPLSSGAHTEKQWPGSRIASGGDLDQGPLRRGPALEPRTPNSCAAG